MSGPRIGILVVAYNAASTLASVLDRIPTEFRDRIDHVMVSDDASSDSTFLVGLGYRETADLPITVVRQDANLGYGGNQKWGYRWAIEHGLDIVVLLHGDGQYAPESLPDIVAPLVDGSADATMGSRMMDPGGARGGGMPLYKWLGNRILTTAQNRLVGASLSEWHSGYRAYRVDALRTLDLDAMSDDFDFDTQILLQLIDRRHRITEIPIPTYYGDEISYVNGLRYAKDIMGHTARHRFRRMGFGAGTSTDAYELKVDAGSSHRVLVDMVPDGRPLRILDLGCSDGVVGGLLVARGHEVIGVDLEAQPGVADRLTKFVAADLDAGLPDDLDGDFDVVMVADVLEHLREPEALLASLSDRLGPGGRVIGSIPNFAHWYPRLRVALGRFDYDSRGILDRGHVRFFTRRSFRSLVDQAGFVVRDWHALGLPVEVFARGGAGGVGTALRMAASVDRAAVAGWPTMFGYQFAFELEPAKD